MLNNPLIDHGSVVITRTNRQPGLAIAKRFAQVESELVLLEDNQDEDQTSLAEMPSVDRKLILRGLDITQADQCELLVQQVWEQRGPISVWINNLGDANFLPAEELSWKAWQATLSELLSGAFFCAQAVGRKMLARGSGVILNIISIDAYMPIEGHIANSVANAGLVALTEGLGIEWAGRGVRVVGIATGFQAAGKTFLDPFSQEHRNQSPAGEPLEAYRQRTPLRRLVTAEEIAEAAFFLCSEAANYITAEILRVDGGWLSYQMF